MNQGTTVVRVHDSVAGGVLPELETGVKFTSFQHVLLRPDSGQKVLGFGQKWARNSAMRAIR